MLQSKADTEKKKRKAKSEAENEMASFVSALQSPGTSTEPYGVKLVPKKPKSSNCSNSSKSAPNPRSSSSKLMSCKSKKVQKPVFESLIITESTSDGIQITKSNNGPTSNFQQSQTNESQSCSYVSSNIQCGSPGPTLSISNSSLSNNSSPRLNLMRNASHNTSSGFVSCGSDQLISAVLPVAGTLIPTNKPHELRSEELDDSLLATPLDGNNLYVPDGQSIPIFSEGPSGNYIAIEYEDQELKLKEALEDAERAKAEAAFWKEKAQEEESLRKSQMGDPSIMAVLDAMKTEMAEMKSQLQTVLGSKCLPKFAQVANWLNECPPPGETASLPSDYSL